MAAGCAAHSSVTVPFTGVPPVGAVGTNASDATVMGLTVNAAPSVVAPSVALTVPCLDTKTGVVFTLKDLAVAPAGTVTEAGALAATSESPSVIFRPPAGAASESVTVPLADLQPATSAFLSTRLVRWGPPEILLPTLTLSSSG